MYPLGLLAPQSTSKRLSFPMQCWEGIAWGSAAFKPAATIIGNAAHCAPIERISRSNSSATFFSVCEGESDLESEVNASCAILIASQMASISMGSLTIRWVSTRSRVASQLHSGNNSFNDSKSETVSTWHSKPIDSALIERMASATMSRVFFVGGLMIASSPGHSFLICSVKRASETRMSLFFETTRWLASPLNPVRYVTLATPLIR